MPSGSVAQLLHRLGEVVGVREHAQHVHVRRERVVVAHRVALVARRNVDGGVAHAKAEEMLRGGVVGEIQAYRRAYRLLLAARLHVQLKDEVRVLVDAPRARGVRRGRRAPGGPHEVEAVGRLHVADVHSGEARLRILGVALSGETEAVDVEDRVVKRARAGTKLPRGDVVDPLTGEGMTKFR